MEYPVCRGCNGKCLVNWSSRWASKEPTSGEIRDEKKTICGLCHGKGFEHIPSPIRIDLSIEEYLEHGRII